MYRGIVLKSILKKLLKSRPHKYIKRIETGDPERPYIFIYEEPQEEQKKRFLDFLKSKLSDLKEKWDNYFSKLTNKQKQKYEKVNLKSDKSDKTNNKKQENKPQEQNKQDNAEENFRKKVHKRLKKQKLLYHIWKFYHNQNIQDKKKVSDIKNSYEHYLNKSYKLDVKQNIASIQRYNMPLSEEQKQELLQNIKNILNKLYEKKIIRYIPEPYLYSEHNLNMHIEYNSDEKKFYLGINDYIKHNALYIDDSGDVSTTNDFDFRLSTALYYIMKKIQYGVELSFFEERYFRGTFLHEINHLLSIDERFFQILNDPRLSQEDKRFIYNYNELINENVNLFKSDVLKKELMDSMGAPNYKFKYYDNPYVYIGGYSILINFFDYFLKELDIFDKKPEIINELYEKLHKKMMFPDESKPLYEHITDTIFDVISKYTGFKRDGDVENKIKNILYSISEINKSKKASDILTILDGEMIKAFHYGWEIKKAKEEIFKKIDNILENFSLLDIVSFRNNIEYLKKYYLKSKDKS